MGLRETRMRQIREEARTHDSGCNCTTCRAADGDQDALSELMRELM